MIIMSKLRNQIITIGAMMLVWAGSAAALDPADKCEAAKLKRAGEYSLCRLKAESKGVRFSFVPFFGLYDCDAQLSQAWSAAETKASGMCPTNGDLGSMQARITGAANDIVDCLNGTCPPSCGDGTANSAESCDGVDLAGESCASLGFASGTLACTTGCGFDVSACLPPPPPSCHDFPATGEKTSYGTGSDGQVEAGAALAYVDNGDGTVTDVNTGLMWEKKSRDGSVHDWSILHSWGEPDTMNGTIVTTFLDTLNDVGGGGASCFAGYCDWRIPNRRELESIVNLDYADPAVDPAFNTACTPNCTVTTCSCTASYYYYSSSTKNFNHTGNAWVVEFYSGIVRGRNKSGYYQSYARAVRGGL